MPCWRWLSKSKRTSCGGHNCGINDIPFAVATFSEESRGAVERQSKEDRTSINQFVATAVAEKLSALQTAEFFTDRKSRADFKAFDKIMKRRGGRLPRAGDEMPSSKSKSVRQGLAK